MVMGMKENKTVYVNIRMPQETVRLMDMLVAKGFFVNRSDLIRAGITLILDKYRRHLEE